MGDLFRLIVEYDDLTNYVTKVLITSSMVNDVSVYIEDVVTVTVRNGDSLEYNIDSGVASMSRDTSNEVMDIAKAVRISYKN